MSEDIRILLFILIVHWVIVFTLVLNTGKWRLAITNLSIQVVYASYFIHGLTLGEPSSALAYFLYFIFFIAFHAVVNSVQLFIEYSKNKKTPIFEEVNIFDWVKFWGNYDHLIRYLEKEIDKDDLTKMKILVDGTTKGWLMFRQEFQNWITKNKQSLNKNEISLIEKLLTELVVKTDLIFKKRL